MSKRATKKAQKDYLGVGAIRLTKLAKTIKGSLVHRGLQRQDGMKLFQELEKVRNDRRCGVP
jgi:hypothetical protein